MKHLFLAIASVVNVVRHAFAGNLRGLLLASLGLLCPISPASAEVLLSCPASTGGDFNDRGFYVPQYPGVTLDSARMQFSAFQVGSYVVSLTVRSNTYDGAILGVATNTIKFTNLATDQNQFVTFAFPSLPVVNHGRICFILTVVSGPYPFIYYSVAPGFTGGCPEVVQTEGTTPPLDTHRRDGVSLVLTGRRVLVSCSGVPGDFYYRGFYIPQYPGVTLDSATLRMSATVAGIYEIALTVLSNAYNGPILAAKTNKVLFSGSLSEGLPVSWTFPSTPIQKYDRVCFRVSLVSGPSAFVYYAVPDFVNGCTDVIETEGTTPPLDTFRRNGVDLVIVGENDPATDLRLNIVQQPAGLFLQWNSLDARKYTVETNANLQTFAPLQSGIIATAPTNTLGPLSPSPVDRQFYRVLQSPAPAP
jgi:hypothetical protein